MELKYKHLFEELEIDTICPPVETKQIEAEAFRWVYDPLNHELNFLPNYAFDKANNNLGIYSPGFLNSTKKCLRCSMSLFITVEAAKINFRKLSKVAKLKLGYTHIASGKIEPSDGLATETTEVGHFSFFEFKDADLKGTFTFCDMLDI
jgi:hypothetical protein